MAEIESIINPDRILNDFRRETVAFVSDRRSIRLAIVAQGKFICQYPPRSAKPHSRAPKSSDHFCHLEKAGLVIMSDTVDLFSYAIDAALFSSARFVGMGIYANRLL